MAKIVIIGCGTMGKAFAEIWSRTHHVHVYDKHPHSVETLRKSAPVHPINDLSEIKDADYLLLAVKPQDAAIAAHSFAKYLNPKTFVLSILAGTSVAALKGYLSKSPILRMMPTITVREGEGIIALVETEETLHAKERLDSLLSPLGTLCWMPEQKVDPFNALIASGPAYLLLIIEAWIEAGIALGFPVKETLHLLPPFFRGTMTWLEQSEKAPTELKWSVAAPKGNTIVGLCEMEKAGVRSGIIQGLLAGYERVLQLHKQE